MPSNKYCEYFDFDEDYFPQINDSSIKENPDLWKKTYPHETFIDMLKATERVLARQEKRSIWVEGAYGTGKSQCVYALKKILDVTEDELRTYWNRYLPLKKQQDLLEKLVGHKRKGIITAYRYASGAIDSLRDLYLAIQDTLKESLVEANLYTGENTLKESVIAWIDEPSHKLFFNALLQEPKWSAVFSQSTADEVLADLRKGGEVKTLMDNIFRLADKEGITALNIDVDRLLAWLADIIDRNNIKVVFIWDEFSDYFKKNRESLSEFQKLVEFVNLKPFYFIVVTHESGHQLATADSTWKKVEDRFVTVEITLPDNIAFNLIGHAFSVKPAARANWNILADDLNARVNNSRSKVMSTANISDPKVMKDMMPLQPMSALLLKNIAHAFKSNQRSMFDFIKSSDTDKVKAFQWFIENTGPFDDHPLLTVDMLWNFFYENGRDNLTSDIRLILDTYPQQQDLRKDEQAVLKAILIMQAIDQRLGGINDLIKPTDQNLSYVFEGITDLDGTKSANLAKRLKDKGILVSTPISDGRSVYAAAVLAGDQAKIDGHKEEVKKNSTTSKLVAEGGLSNILPLSPALRLRFETEPGSGKITPVTVADFTRSINVLREKATRWNFHAVIAFAKDDMEAATFRKILRAAVAEKDYENIVFIDALSTPLGQEAFEQYVDLSAMAMYYSGNQNVSSREYADKAKRVLDQDWKNRIYNGQFVIYTYANQEGEKLGNGQGVASVLQTIVTNKFQHVFDFENGLTESQLKITPAMRQSAKSGIIQDTSGVVVNIEKRVIPTVWGLDKYWENPLTSSLSISKIKISVEKLIETAFESDGHISIDDIYDFLEDTYGFAPCNLSSFLTGFLLKEYSGEPFRYSDSSGGHEPMSSDKLAEMIGNYIGKTVKTTYIVKMTADEMAFYDITEKAWGIPANSCSSADQAARAVSKQMRDELKLPVWCLEKVDYAGVFDVVHKYIELVQKEGNEAHKKAVEIGRIASSKPYLADNLFSLLTSENCQKGMREYLHFFEDGKVMDLCIAIGAENNVLEDIRRLFSVKHSSLWDKETGEDEIRKLITEYSVVKETNYILNTFAHSLNEAYKEWRERLKFVTISCEALQSQYPTLAKSFDILLKIYKQEEILPEQLKAFQTELVSHGTEIKELLNNDMHIFAKIYEDYLKDLGIDDISVVKTEAGIGLFVLPKSDCNIKIRDTAEDVRKKLLRTQLVDLWKEKTKTRNPRDWSNRYRTPILSCVSEKEFDSAKKAFLTLNHSSATDYEIKFALDFLKSAAFFNDLEDDDNRNAAFIRDIIGVYSTLLQDIDKVRDALDDLSIDVYDWRDNPNVKARVKRLANAEYNAGGSDKVLMIIDEMGDERLKEYLKRLVKENITVGIEILASRGGE